MGGIEGDGLLVRAVGGEGPHARAAPFCQPHRACSVDDRTIWFGSVCGQVEEYFRCAFRPTIRIKGHAHDLAGGGIREMGKTAMGGKADGIRDADTGIKAAEFTPIIAVDSTCAGFCRLAHGADPEAAKRIGAAIVGAGEGIIGF